VNFFLRRKSSQLFYHDILMKFCYSILESTDSISFIWFGNWDIKRALAEGTYSTKLASIQRD